MVNIKERPVVDTHKIKRKESIPLLQKNLQVTKEDSKRGRMK